MKNKEKGLMIFLVEQHILCFKTSDVVKIFIHLKANIWAWPWCSLSHSNSKNSG